MKDGVGVGGSKVIDNPPSGPGQKFWHGLGWLAPVRFLHAGEAGATSVLIWYCTVHYPKR